MTYASVGPSVSVSTPDPPARFGAFNATYVWLVMAVLCGLCANIGLMKLNSMHRGCANVCTLAQFTYGFGEAWLSPTKRRFLTHGSERKLPLLCHVGFACMFFLGPFLGNMAISITQADFYPVFLVLRSCGTVPSMMLGWLFTDQKFTLRQAIAVLCITGGAAMTTLGCYQGGAHAVGSSEGTATPLFLAGLVLLLINMLVDSGLGVIQQRVFEQYGRHVDESVTMMSAIGTCIMALLAGRDAVQYIHHWAVSPTWLSLPILGVTLPLEFFLLSLNFVGNWNAKKIATWLNAHSTAVVSTLVPMTYRLLSSIISTTIFEDRPHPLYTWIGTAAVFFWSLIYLWSPTAKSELLKF